MNSFFKKLSSFLAISLVSLVFVSPVFAAAPDGLGPWADSVVIFSQGLEKGGAAVPAVRSNPTAALGVAEADTVEGHFVSLGFSGVLTLGFTNGISGGSLVVESTNPGYPIEKANVEFSENGTTWVSAGTISQTATVNQPAGVTCAKYVRITDVSNPSDFSDTTADGYDVDGVKAIGNACTPPTTDCGNTCGCTDIKQTNTTNATVVINSTTNTGKNKTNSNTGGSNTTTTGNASSNTTVNVTGGDNIATAGCCNGDSNPSINISNNGAGSKNVVKVNSNKKSPKLK